CVSSCALVKAYYGGVIATDLWQGSARRNRRLRAIPARPQARRDAVRALEAHFQTQPARSTMRVVTRRAAMLRRARPRWRHSQRAGGGSEGMSAFEGLCCKTLVETMGEP